MAQGTFKDLLEYIEVVQPVGFEIFTGDPKNKSYLYMNNAEISLQDQVKAMSAVMERVQGKYFTFVGWKTNAKNSALLYYTFTNEPALDSYGSPASANAHQSIGMSSDLIDERIRVAVEGVRSEYKMQDLQRREQELAAREQEYRQEKESAIGIILSQAGKYLSKIPQLQVAGVEQPPTHQAVATTTQEVTEQEQMPSEQVSHIEQLLNRWYAADPDCFTMLEKVVELAEAGDSTYNMAKGFLK